MEAQVFGGVGEASGADATVGAMAMLVHWWEALARWLHSINWHDPSWVGAIGQCVGAIATFAAVIVALWLPRWERRKAAADRRNQQREQQLHNARLVTVSVPRDQPAAECIAIFNGSDQPVFQPRVDSVRDPDVYWDQDPQWSTFDAPWEPTFFPEVLPPKATHYLMYGYFNPDDSEVTGEIEKRIRAEDVTITFMDTSRQQWRRTGSGEPVRVVQQRTP